MYGEKMSENKHPIRYCVQDNDDGPVAYCYNEKDATDIVKGLNYVNGIDPVVEVESNGYNRFAYEDMRQYHPADPSLALLIVSQLMLGLFEK